MGDLTTIGSDNGLLHGRRQAIIWTIAGILLFRPLGTNFSEILSEIHTFSFKKIHLKTSSAKRRPFCLGLNVLNHDIRGITGKILCRVVSRYINFKGSPANFARSIVLSVTLGPGGRFKNTYELLNPRALKISMLYKNIIFQCMGKIFCVEFQRSPLKFHTKYLTHTLKDMTFIQHWNFKSS